MTGSYRRGDPPPSPDKFSSMGAIANNPEASGKVQQPDSAGAEVDQPALRRHKRR
jgi:hypothetical protein